MDERVYQEAYTTISSENATSSQALPPALSSNLPGGYPYLLQLWLDLPTTREQRCFLENHSVLLTEYNEQILRRQRAQELEDTEQAQRNYEASILLQDAKRRGGTVEAVREAYVNLYGGFGLDLPPWLETVAQQVSKLLMLNRPDETAEMRVALLEEALEQVQGNASTSPELLATLCYELASAWIYHPHADRIQALETAIDLCEKVLRIYTLVDYPYQYAKAQHSRARAYWEYTTGKRRDNLEQAIACYHEALRVRTLAIYPLEYATTQNSLGVAYEDRVAGERRENLERAIVCYHEALRVHTLDTFPFEYARAQNNLGLGYWERVAGERRENLERAIVCFHEALRVHTLDAFPFEYARTQNNLGVAYHECLVEERRESLERAIVCYHEALRVWTLDAFPFSYAMAQQNLGNTYRERVAGKRQENFEQAIACFHEALRVWTLDAFPFYYASIQLNLGITYRMRFVGEQRENLQQAIMCFHEALRISTVEAFPRVAREVFLQLAEIEAQRANWKEAQAAYAAALQAEDLLIILGTGTLGRDAILKEGRDAAMRQGYVFHRLGQVREAAVVIEQGRARGLAEAMAFDAADPALITQEARRSRYTATRAELVAAQVDLHTLIPHDLDEHGRRHLDLERTGTYRHVKATFDALVTEIRDAHDPDDFLSTSLDATTILRAATHIGPGHTLVYLVATPWGGVAVAAHGGRGQKSSSSQFASLDLPDLTESFVNSLIETRLSSGPEQFIGGFMLAQIGEGFEHLCQEWEGETLQSKVQTLQTACRNAQQHSTMEEATHRAMTCPLFAALAYQPLTSLTREDRHLLAATFDAFFLQQELSRCLQLLSSSVLSPVMTWLQEQGTTSLTIIPCGQLASFPLTTTILADGRLVGEIFPTSVAPSARSLLRTTPLRSHRAGIATLGDPHENLGWSEAEALALTTLARRAALPAEVHLKKRATRERLLAALKSRWIVNVCCHGIFDTQDFLQSALLLAGKGRITMAEMLNHLADLRGVRLLLLSACQTALLDLQGARDEAHSLAVAMLQAGAQAVIAAQWAVDDKATYLLMVRFVQEWFPHLEQEPPVMALTRAQTWLRCVTNAELAVWYRTMPMATGFVPMTRLPEQHITRSWQRITVRGRSLRWHDDDAQVIVRLDAEKEDPFAQPYADPYYWAGFQVIGW
ncbi:CHAT domain-containing tetratricopeptide repeat protein [Dictyobacter arantiisoli]|uniref:CHAT domain-containing protein n=1 Tax=Dictyobacter arantiisoli TaxID=2014874 RepID=A0A5A5TAW4_9CHLR|nr:CHAT domain-containing tetratricopeptide repeat protein [Dictyobacter arantiisoli]GCF08497.1 hypothetical protein KDI_20610 [Dictyobacter arantiisoli]